MFAVAVAVALWWSEEWAGVGGRESLDEGKGLLLGYE
jgi:hypothetical protein